MIVALFLIYAVSGVWASDSCPNLQGFAQQLAVGSADFPIEKYYPAMKVSPGVIPRGSKAFQLWRDRTPPHIPDEAFNWHYYTAEQMEEKAGFLKLKAVASTSDDIKTVAEKMPPAAEEKLRKFYESRSSLGEYSMKEGTDYKVLARYSTGSEFLSKLKIEPKLTKENVAKLFDDPNVDGKYFLTASGDFYFFSKSDMALIRKNIGFHREPTHEDLAEIVFCDRKKGATQAVKLIDYGYVEAFPDLKRVLSSFGLKFGGQKHTKFETVEYLKARFQREPSHRILFQ